jgi:hypothetical protein
MLSRKVEGIKYNILAFGWMSEGLAKVGVAVAPICRSVPHLFLWMTECRSALPEPHAGNFGDYLEFHGPRA